MSLFKVPFDDFARRFKFMQKKEPDYPLRYYEDDDSFYLYWTDIDLKVMETVVAKSSLRGREEEQNFRYEFLTRAVRLADKYNTPVFVEEASEDPVFDIVSSDLLEPISPGGHAEKPVAKPK